MLPIEGKPVIRKVKRLLATERMAGIADQAFFTLATFAMTYVYARFLPPEAFGTFALVQGICLIAQGGQRAVCVLPMIITSNHDGVSQRWAQFDLFIRIFVACVLAGTATCLWMLAINTALTHALWLAALCSLATLAYEFQRRCLFVQRLTRAVVLVAAAYLVMNLSAVLVVFLWFRTVEAAAVGLFLCAGLAALLARAIRQPNAQTDGELKEHLGLAGWNLLSYMAYAVYNNGMILIVGVTMDVRTVALFSASRLFTAPIQTLLQAIDSVDTPRARRKLAAEGIAGLTNSLRRTRIALMALGIPYLVILVAVARPLSDLLFAGRYPGMHTAIYTWAGVSLFMLLSQPLETGLTILRKVSVFFWTRTLAAAATVAALLISSNIAGSISPILSLVFGWSISGALAWLLLNHYIKTYQCR